jgi:hypothetical protein
LGIDGVRDEEVVVSVPVPFGVREQINLRVIGLLAVDLRLLLHQPHPQVELVTVLLSTELLPLEVLRDFVGTLDCVLGLSARHVCAVGELEDGVGDFMEVERVDLDGETDEAAPVCVQHEVVVGLREDAQILGELSLPRHLPELPQHFRQLRE